MRSKVKVYELLLVRTGLSRGWSLKRAMGEAIIYPPNKRKIPVIRRKTKKVVAKTDQAGRAGSPKAG